MVPGQVEELPRGCRGIGGSIGEDGPSIHRWRLEIREDFLVHWPTKRFPTEMMVFMVVGN